MNQLLDWFHTRPPAEAAFWLLIENLALFGMSLALGTAILRLSPRLRHIGGPPDPVDRTEILLAATTVLLNWAITFIGWILWRADLIRIRTDTGPWAWLDVLWLLLIMDLAMYILHRGAHLSWFYPIHEIHHRYDRPRPLDLFVLHPLETLGFGTLWLLVVLARPWSILGMSVYLTLNLLSGTIGHLGIEPLPARLRRLPLLRSIGTSTFHAQHHQDVARNFGFYSTIWDQLFRTLKSHP